MAWELKDTTFKDVNGTTWSVEVDPFTVERCKKETGVDLYRTVNDDGTDVFSSLASDPVLLVGVIYTLCEDQVKERGIADPREFGKLLRSGEAIEAAAEALINGLLNFTHPRRREVLATLVEKGRQMEDAMLGRMEARLASGEVDRTIESLLEKFDSSFTSAVASLASPDLEGSPSGS